MKKKLREPSNNYTVFQLGQIKQEDYNSKTEAFSNLVLWWRHRLLTVKRIQAYSDLSVLKYATF